VHTPRCLLGTVKLHSRVRDNSCRVGAIAFKNAWDALVHPNSLETLYSSTVFSIQGVLNLPSTSQPLLTA
jgi:hypothetical protein